MKYPIKLSEISQMMMIQCVLSTGLGKKLGKLAEVIIFSVSSCWLWEAHYKLCLHYMFSIFRYLSPLY